MGSDQAVWMLPANVGAWGAENLRYASGAYGVRLVSIGVQV